MLDYYFLSIYNFNLKRFFYLFVFKLFFSVAISVSPHVCFILVLILISMLLR